MNDITPVPPGQLQVVLPQSDSGALMQIIARAATDSAFDVAKLEKLLAMKERWDAAEAKKAYDTAFAAFKAEAVRIVKNKDINDGPLRGKRYADLFAVVDSVTPALSLHGLSASWELIKDEEKWLEVACILTHVGGHSERRKMGGPPDLGGAKNAIQARASALSYLERYSFLMAIGMAAAETDNDGRGSSDTGGATERPDPWTEQAKAAALAEAVKGPAAYQKWWKSQADGFRRAAVNTSYHSDMKAKAQEAA